MTVSYRMYTDLEVDAIAKFNPIIASLKGEASDYKLFNIFEAIGTPADSATELDACDNQLNGTTTPVILEVHCASATDTNATNGAARAIYIIGYTVASATDYAAGNETPAWTIESVALAGLTKTYTTKYYLRVVHAYVYSWGTGGSATHDAEGAITITNMPREQEVTTIVTKASSAISDGDYIVIFAADGDNTETEHYFWFDQTGSGSDPTPGTGTAHEVTITSDTEVTAVTCKNAWEIDNQDYVMVPVSDGDGTETAHYFWFDVDTTGTDPVVASATQHEVAIHGTVETTALTMNNSWAIDDGGSTADYITFSVADGDNTETDHYVWFDYSGSGVDPAVEGATGHEVNIAGAFEIYAITPKDSWLIDDADSIHVFAADGDNTETEHYFWFDYSGAGADPTETGTAHEVDIAGACEVTDITFDGSWAIADADYVSFSLADGDNTETSLYIWFDKSGAAVDPEPGGTGYEVTITGDLPEITTVDFTDINSWEVSDAEYVTFEVQDGDGTTTAHYVWFDYSGSGADPVVAEHTAHEVSIAGTYEITAITPKDSWLIDDADYVSFSLADGDDTETAHYIWFDYSGAAGDPAPGGTGHEVDIAGVAEIQTVTMNTPGNIANGDYFTFYIADGDGTETGHYCWFDTDGAGADPTLGGGLTAHEVDIQAAADEEDVADAVVAVIDALDNIGAANVLAVVTLTNANYGNTTAPVDGDHVTTAIATTTPGSIKTAADVATAIAAVIEAIDGVGASADGSIVTITNDNYGNVTDTAQTGACMTTVSKTQDGSILDDEGVASAVADVINALDNVGAGAVGPVVTITNTEDGNVTNAAEFLAANPVVTVTQAGSVHTASQIATAVAAVIDPLDNVGAAADGAVVTLTNTLYGNVTNATDSATCTTDITVSTPGSIKTAADVATALAAVITALAGFGAAADGSICTVTNAKYGNVTNATQNGECCTSLTKTQDGSIKDTEAVATATAAVINGVTGCGAAAVAAVVTVTNDEYGNVTNAADSASCTTNITVSQAGTIKTSTDVATLLAAAIDAVDNVGATSLAAVVTITNALPGNTTDVSQVGACMTTITKTQDGAYLTDAEVATALEAVIEAVTGLDSTVSTNTVVVTCTLDGTTTNASDESTCCVSIETTTEGANITVYLTIDAGDNESNGTNIFCPDGWNLVMFPPHMHLVGAIGATTFPDGTTIQYVYTGFDDANNTAPDQNTESFSVYGTGPITVLPFDQNTFKMPRTGTTGAIVTIKDLKLTNARATDVEIFALLYKERV